MTQLHTDGSDAWDIEVKRASGGVPDVAETLSAFGNMPEGGTLVFGLDESERFAPVGVFSAAELEQGIASQARQKVEPPVQVNFWNAEVSGKTLVIANVTGLPSYQRPCRVKRSKKAYLRFADGDYQLADQEIQQMLSVRERPRNDSAIVNGATRKDLDPDLTQQFVTVARTVSRRLAREDDEQILRMKRVIDPDTGQLTVAGLYALGRYPQQFVPSLSLTAVLRPPPGMSDRNADRQVFDGPLPEILVDAVQWVVRNIRTRVRFGPDGHGFDSAEVPIVAIREIIANALVHRDLSQHTSGRDVQLIVDNDRLVVVNPGGLWGLSVDQLGKGNAKSAVNEFLYDICQLTTTSAGHRVIEGEGGGLREVLRVLRRAGMKEPRFFDSGVQFTAVLPRHSLLTEEDFEWLDTLPRPEALTDMQRQVLVSMRRGQAWTNQMVRDEFGPLDSTEARTLLQGLVQHGLVETSGGGRGTVYTLVRAAGHGVESSPQLELEWRVTDMSPPHGSLDAEGPASPSPGPASHVAGGIEGQLEATSKNGPGVWEALEGGPQGIRRIQESTALNVGQVRYALKQLMAAGFVVRDGGQGDRQTTYRRSDSRGQPS